MSTATTKVTVTNNGQNRIIVGPPARSKGGGTSALIRLDTPADAKVPADRRLGQSATIEGEQAAALRGSKAFTAATSRFDIKVS